MIAKILNLKGYHNSSGTSSLESRLFVIAKILNLKGYHNQMLFRRNWSNAVCDSKDTKFERISQLITIILIINQAVCDSKDTKFERISQPACKIGHFFGAVCASKDTSHDGHSLRLPG